MRCSVTWNPRLAIHRAAPPALALLLAACSAPQHMFSTDPVDPDGAPLPWEQVRRVELESGQSVELRAEEVAVRQGDRLLVATPSGTATADGSGWALEELWRVELVAPGARRRTVDVCTPDDLWAAEDEPRVESVELRDGTRIELDPRARGPRLDLGGTVVNVALADGRQRQLLLADVKTLVITRGGFVGSTLRSPATWLVAAATAGVLVLITSTHDDANDAVE